MELNEQPSWLANWQSQPTNHHSGPRVAPKPAAQPEPTKPKANFQGFIIPERWPCDNGTRREPVMDMDTDPPRIVRYVGWKKCMRCGKWFFSEDVTRLRMCDETSATGVLGCRRKDVDYDLL